MFFLLFVSIVIMVYVATFSKDFNEEDIAKAFPFIVIVCLLLVVIGIASSV